MYEKALEAGRKNYVKKSPTKGAGGRRFSVAPPPPADFEDEGAPELPPMMPSIGEEPDFLPPPPPTTAAPPSKDLKRPSIPPPPPPPLASVPASNIPAPPPLPRTLLTPIKGQLRNPLAGVPKQRHGLVQEANPVSDKDKRKSHQVVVDELASVLSQRKELSASATGIANLNERLAERAKLMKAKTKPQWARED